MHAESDSQWNELDKVLGDSLRTGRSFTRLLFDSGPKWSARELGQFINEVGMATVATSSSQGWPHAAVVPIRCVDGRIVAATSAESVLARNLAENPRLGFSVVGQGHIVFGQGRMTHADWSETLSAAFANLDDGPHSEPRLSTWKEGLVTVTATRIFAS